MFTGIVEEIGVIVGRKPASNGLTLTVRAPRTAASAKLGDSVCTQGVCLTCVHLEGDRFTADVSAETLRRTTLGEAAVGDRVNLEPALSLGDRIGGHLVTGHVDGTGRVETIRADGEGKWVTFQAPGPLLRYVVEKGSIAVDGVSLTVAGMSPNGFHVALIPHTLSVTTLGALRPGARVNLEVDIIGKYVERLLATGSERTSQLWESLARAGFVEAHRSDEEDER